jgi:hypothetical protein
VEGFFVVHEKNAGDALGGTLQGWNVRIRDIFTLHHGDNLLVPEGKMGRQKYRPASKTLRINKIDDL